MFSFLHRHLLHIDKHQFIGDLFLVEDLVAEFLI